MGHSISDQELADAPSWAQVLPRYLAAVAGKTILACNSSFDRGVRGARRHVGLNPADLPGASRA